MAPQRRGAVAAPLLGQGGRVAHERDLAGVVDDRSAIGDFDHQGVSQERTMPDL